MEDKIRKAERADFKKLESFLVEANVASSNLEDYIDYYSLLETKSGTLKACIGIEPVGNVGLLRSFVVSPGTTQVQVMMLFDRVVRIAEGNQLDAVYLVTNKQSAVTFFSKMGFQVEDQPEASLVSHPHFQQLSTVDNAFVMQMPVEKK